MTELTDLEVDFAAASHSSTYTPDERETSFSPNTYHEYIGATCAGQSAERGNQCAAIGSGLQEQLSLPRQCGNAATLHRMADEIPVYKYAGYWGLKWIWTMRRKGWSVGYPPNRNRYSRWTCGPRNHYLRMLGSTPE